MSYSEEGLWVTPNKIDPQLDLDTIDSQEEDLLEQYAFALEACQAATQLLWTLSGRKFHTGAAVTEQYVTEAKYVSPWAGQTGSGNFVLDRFGVYLLSASDVQSARIYLSGKPVKSIGAVTDIATGRTLDPSEYTVVNRTFLQLSSLPANGVDVSYTYGQQPPALGKLAALQMARNFYYLWSGREDECNLPDRVTSVTRQGMSFVLLDNQDFVDELKTGVYIVDLFLKSVNPAKATQRAKVFSVDVPRGRRRSL